MCFRDEMSSSPYTWRPASKAFGSFQSEDPEALIRVAEADYTPPPRLA